ncbi:MAG: hypothetical protein Q8K36_03995, partial [Alphaproteobacteria bacterium]|nr:hypothetical protein [Alphaproteobacteria bacterium]
MKSSTIPLTALIHQRLQYLNKRSEILTGNIARADIPGARRQDLRPFQTITKNTHSKKYSASSRPEEV